MSPEKAQAYWKENISMIIKLLIVWFIVSFGCGILFINELNAIEISGVKLGYWFAQQGAIYVFVILIFVGCFISATTFTYSLFNENPLISTPFGVFWALMISIIYLLLLYTITPPILPNNNKKSRLLEKTSNHSDKNKIYNKINDIHLVDFIGYFISI